MTNGEALPDDVPYKVAEKNGDRAVVQFAEYVDHRRTPELEKELLATMRAHRQTACDFTSTVEVDSDWLALLAQITLEARASGKRVGLVGLSDTLKKSADVVGLKKKLDLFDTIEDVWK